MFVLQSTMREEWSRAQFCRQQFHRRYTLLGSYSWHSSPLSGFCCTLGWGPDTGTQAIALVNYLEMMDASVTHTAHLCGNMNHLFDI